MHWRGILVSAVLVGSVAAASPAPGHLTLMSQRSSAQDLEISGDVPGMAAGASRFVSYAALSQLPQVSATVRNDENFSGPVQLSGVSLDAVLAALGVEGKDQLIAAMSTDGYEAHYTTAYRAAHHPILVLKIEGKEPAQWMPGPDGAKYQPYVISNPDFRPAFHVLAHKDMAQVPYGVTGLKLYPEKATLAALQPKSGGVAAMEGYRIAVQNCLRCHRAGDIGGSKSPFGWPQMGLIAQGNAAAFGKYVVRPNAVNPEATMPPNPEYNAATIAALTAYFQSVAKAGP
jgi:mono/diheme cytochrome c family protein